jgi:hypothetical protein
LKCAATRPYADPEKAPRRIVEIASTVEAVQNGRIYIELINHPFLFTDKASPAEYGAGLKLAIDRGWLHCNIWYMAGCATLADIRTATRFAPGTSFAHCLNFELRVSRRHRTAGTCLFRTTVT